jgi:hypothetical protein
MHSRTSLVPHLKKMPPISLSVLGNLKHKYYVTTASQAEKNYKAIKTNLLLIILHKSGTASCGEPLEIAESISTICDHSVAILFILAKLPRE